MDSQDPADSTPQTPFASKTLTEHILRGIIGAGAVGCAVYSPYLLLTIAFIGIAIFCFRGCPTCWSVGLYETCKIPARKNKDTKAS